MNVSEYKKALKICRNANVPLMVWGPGGVGKTRGSEQVAEELGIKHLMIQGPLLQPVDLMGLPERDGRKTIWLRPEILPTEGEGIISIEELPDSPPLMQKAYYQLILEKQVQTHKVPDSWYIHGTGNRVVDGGFSSPMPAPLITRFTHIGVYCDSPDFSEETPKTASIDQNDFLKYAIDNFHPYISAFLKLNPSYIYQNQAVPRTWENVSKFLNSESDYYSFEFKELIVGTVGNIPGSYFNTFLQIVSKIPSIDAIIKTPLLVDVPDDQAVLFAVLTILIQKTDKDTVDNIIKYILRLSDDHQFFYFFAVQKRFPEIMTNADYINWKNVNKDSFV